MQTIKLEEYSITVGNAATSLNAYMKGSDYSKIFVIVDENTKQHCWPTIQGCVPNAIVIEIKSGEINKSLESTTSIWHQLKNAKADRHSFVINLGGGVIGDMGGFSASCYMRGIDFIQIPTTLLSQVDASVGGKLGIDFEGLKNFIGLFKNPKRVIVDPTFLATLSARERRSGFAEMIKHALIQDSACWERINKVDHWQQLDWGEEIYRSILIKKQVVEKDPFEGGLRKILNFGHTIGHAVESLSFETNNPYVHGEAIAIGMICEAYLSTILCGLPQKDFDAIKSYILSIYDDLTYDVLANVEAITVLLMQDKKNKNGKAMFSLLESVGSCTYNIEVGPALIKESLSILQSK